MNRQQILLALALYEVGVPIEVRQFDQRLVIQKSVCILQHAGVQLGYRFRWYLHGPYSSDLASDAFLLVGLGDQLRDELKDWRLDEPSRRRIADLKRIFSEAPLAKLPKRLELLACVLFIVRTGQAKGEDYSRIAELLKVNEKPFSETDVSMGAASLRHYGIAL